MFSKIESYCNSLVQEYNVIPEERKELLSKLSEYISLKRKQGRSINLVYICTHNSRRSHFGQVWAKVAGDYFNIPNVNTYSGGTEATVFNSNAIDALKRAGFEIKSAHLEKNPIFHVYYNEAKPPIECFSKVYDHPKNPKSEFAAIMTCSDAEKDCPFIPQVELRIGITYDDPKVFDNTPLQDKKYSERCRQIALETFYAFSKVK